MHPPPCLLATNASRHFVCGWPTNWSAITTAANVWAVLVPSQHILPYHPCTISGLCRHRLHTPPSTYHHVRRTRGSVCTAPSTAPPADDVMSCGSARSALASHHSALLGMRMAQIASACTPVVNILLSLFCSSSPPLLCIFVAVIFVYLLCHTCTRSEHMNGVACMCAVIFLCHVCMTACASYKHVFVSVLYMFGLCTVCLVLSGKISRHPRGTRW